MTPDFYIYVFTLVCQVICPFSFSPIPGLSSAVLLEMESNAVIAELGATGLF